MLHLVEQRMLFLSICAGLSFSVVPAVAQDVPADYQEVLQVLEQKIQFKAGVLQLVGRQADYKTGVLKLNISRGDLKMTIQGVATVNPFGVGGWVAFTKGTNGTDVMIGDLALLQEEVNPVMSVLLDNGIEITALHNHFFWDDPRVFYMHVHGVGKATDLARHVKPGLDLIGRVKPLDVSTSEAKRPEPDTQITQSREDLGIWVARSSGKGTLLDRERLAKIVGRPGENIGNVFKFTVGRDDLAMNDHGAVINARMGLSTWAAFLGTQEDAAVAGDVAMLENELTPVLKVLRKNGIDIVAIHHQMTEDRPVVIILHYWGRGPAEKLAVAFKTALDELGKGDPAHGMGR